jgi:hypothetical protein
MYLILDPNEIHNRQGHSAVKAGATSCVPSLPQIILNRIDLVPLVLLTVIVRAAGALGRTHCLGMHPYPIYLSWTCNTCRKLGGINRVRDHVKLRHLISLLARFWYILLVGPLVGSVGFALL